MGSFDYVIVCDIVLWRHRHRTAQGHVVSGRDRRAPYPSMHEREEFIEEAGNFTRMDMTTKEALSTLANLAQVGLLCLVSEK